VRPNGNQPGWEHVTARCNARVADAAINPDHWGGMAVDGAGNVVVSDAELHLILRFSPGGTVEHVAGGGAQACAYDRYKTLQKEGYLDGPAGQALFKQPRGLAFDRDGTLLVADSGNCALRRIDKAGNVTTVRKGCAADDKNPNDENTRIRYEHVAVGRDGQPVVGGARFARMEQYGNIFRILPDGRVEQLLAGRRFRPQSRQQQLQYLTGITVLPNGALLITDGNPEVSRVYEVREGRLLTVAGLGGVDMLGSNVDGPVSQARIREPGGLCASPEGAVFVRPNSGGRPLRKIDPQTRAVSTWAY
jgi:sugar lactone lactonase YvrE